MCGQKPTPICLDAKSGDSTLKVDKTLYTLQLDLNSKPQLVPYQNYYMIETPTRYKPILAFKLGGYGTVLGASTGQGFGLRWRQDEAWRCSVNIAANYVADGGDGTKATPEKVFGETRMVSQVGYGNRKWYVSALYALKNAGQRCAVEDADGDCIATSAVPAAMGYSTPTAKRPWSSSRLWFTWLLAAS